MIQSGGRRLLLLDPPWMIHSRASGLISPDHAVVGLWPLLLFRPRIIESRAFHCLVTALLHDSWLLRASTSLLHHGLVLLAAALHLLCLVHLSASLHHHGVVLIIFSPHLFGLVLITASLHHHGLVLMAASLHRAASSTGLLVCFTTALSSSMLHCISSASFSLLYAAQKDLGTDEIGSPDLQSKHRQRDILELHVCAPLVSDSSSESESPGVSASLLLCVDERGSVCFLAGDDGLQTGAAFEVLDERVQRSSNFKIAWNCNRVEALDPLMPNWYKVDPCHTSALHSFHLQSHGNQKTSSGRIWRTLKWAQNTNSLIWTQAIV